MDILKLVSIIILSLPLFYSFYLFFCKIKLILVNKKVFNYGVFSLNLLNFVLISVLTFFVYFKSQNIDLIYNLFNFFDIKFLFQISINKENSLFALLVGFFYLLINLYTIKFFRKKRQFLFTKQRFYTLFSLLIFNTYLFLFSLNLLQCLIISFVQTTIIILFSYYDIFKANTNLNLIRALKLNFLFDFSLLFLYLILFKFFIFQSNLFESFSFNFELLNKNFSYFVQNGNIFEVKLFFVFLLILLFSKSLIVPFSCYYSFFANSSDIIYLPILICANNIFALYLYFNLLNLFDYFPFVILILKIFAIITIIFSIFSIICEKSIKIIFGYLLSMINSIFIIVSFYFENWIYYYFSVLFLFLFLLIKILLKDRNNITFRLIAKNKGFYLERLNIFLFEKLFNNFSKFILFVNKITFGIFYVLFSFVTKFLSNVLIIKYLKVNRRKILRNIFIIFGLMLIFLIIIMLFEGVYFE